MATIFSKILFYKLSNTSSCKYVYTFITKIYSSGKTTLDICKLVPTLKLNQVILNKNIEKEILDYVKDNVNVENVATYYQLAKVFNLPSFAKETLRCMERCFPKIVETSNFLELDVCFISRFLSSPKLFISSELEVFQAADSWLSYNHIERNMFAEDLLLMIRFSLLSDQALEHILQRSSAFRKNEKCNLIVRDILHDKENFFIRNKLNRETRYCDHDDFDIIVVGGNFDLEQFVNQIDKRRKVTPLCSVVVLREWFASVCLNDNIYVFGGSQYEQRSVTLMKYSPGFDDKWQQLADLDLDRSDFSLCAFMNKIYIIGGCDAKGKEIHSSCIELDTKTYEWKEVAVTNHCRVFPASTVFEGRVVTCGGMGENNSLLNAVEAYDHVADQWSYMTNMIERRYRHKIVALRNKLFVFGSTTTNEVFDSVCNKFVYLKPLKKSLKVNLELLCDVTLVGSRITIFIQNSPLMAIYDTDKNEWSEESCEITAGQFPRYTSAKFARICDKM